MRIANLAGRAVLVLDDTAIDLERASDGLFGPDPQALYERWDELTAWAEDAVLDVALQSIAEPIDPKLLESPVPRPGQIVAAGLNYREHAAETGAPIGEGFFPPIFAKFRSSVTGPNAVVELPEGNIDWEVELALVIGRRAWRVSAEDAWDHVAGLTISQDLSERVRQLAGPVPQFGLPKSHPGFTPLGPVVVTTDEVANPDDLALSSSVNGVVMQNSRTSSLIVDVPGLISELTKIIVLEPGDVILTGTPSGVGVGRKPQVFLQPGDVLVSEIEGLGTQRQEFVAAGASVAQADEELVAP